MIASPESAPKRFFAQATQPLRDYGNFWIRVSRKEFWSFAALFAVLLAIAVGILALTGWQFTAVAPMRWDITPPAAGFGTASAFGGILLAGLMLAYGIPILATVIGRLHDLGRSGWWLLVFIFGDSLTISLGGTDIWTLIIDIAFVVTMSLKGQPGVNRFGDPPGAAEEPELVAP